MVLFPQAGRQKTIFRHLAAGSITVSAVVAGAVGMGTAAPTWATTSQPNIVMILADDLGYGSVGAYGSQVIKTPNLDALAAAGVAFSQAYACPVCAPARSSINTGFHQGHGPIDRNAGNAAFRYEDVLSGDVMSAAGYHTASFGKWGFGAGPGTETSSNLTDDLAINPTINSPSSLPTNHGFETFYGYLNHGAAHSYFVDPLWEATLDNPTMHTSPTGNNAGDNSTNTHSAYSDDLITDHALDYIQNNAGGTQPFYMQVNLISPHQDLDAIAYVNYDVNGNPQSWDAGYQNQGLFDKQKKYAAMITRLDAHVGQIMAQLADPNGDGDTSDSILDNTLIIFTSDNGGVSGDSLSATDWKKMAPNGTLRGGKQDLYEGGIRVPMIMSWQGVIAPGTTSDLVVDFTDLLPTFADLAGVDAPIGVDGTSFQGELTGAGVLRTRKYHVWENYDVVSPVDPAGTKASAWAILDKDQYKLIKYQDGTYDLFNLATDPDESTPLNPTTYAGKIADLTALALAEGVEQPDGYKISHANWTGPDGGNLNSAGNWSNGQTLQDYSVATIDNTTASARTLTATASLTSLGLEVMGSSAAQTLVVPTGVTVHGRNQVRINAGGRINLEGGNLTSARWVDVKANGALTGQGHVGGDVYNWGLVAPGQPGDLQMQSLQMQSFDTVDTGVVSAIVFNFTGVQDPAELTATSTLSPYLQLTTGLHMGAGVSARNANNKGSEFNLQGMNSTTLALAITNNDYLGYTVDPVDGIEMSVDSLTFKLWRNGTGAATNYAILTSQKPFASGQELATLSTTAIGTSAADQITFTAPTVNGDWTSDPVDVRIYGWGASAASGNTHYTAASMNAAFRSVAGSTVVIDGTSVLTLDGDYHQFAGAVLAMDLGGTDANPANPAYDQLVVVGDVTLEGILDISLVDGFTPQLGDVFTLVTAHSIDGTFSALVAPTLDNGLGFGLQYTTTGVNLVVQNVPEPSSLLLLGVTAPWFLRRRRR